MIFKKRKNEYRNNELPGILIYGWKKKIIEWAWYLFALAFLVGFEIIWVCMPFICRDWTVMAEMLQEIFQPQYGFHSLVYAAFAVWNVPVLLVYAVVCIGERRFLRVYREMPQEAKKALYMEYTKGPYESGMWIHEAQGYIRFNDRDWMKRASGLYEAHGYILFRDHCFLWTPQIVELSDIVWGYLGRSDFQITNMEKNFISPNLQFFSLYFYTKDGRRHRVFLNVLYEAAAKWFVERCPNAIFGYGKEQKRRAEEIFIKEAERTNFLTGEKKNSYLVRKRRTVAAAAAGSILAVLFLTAGFYGWQYINSDEFLYRKNIWQAKRWYAKGEFYDAYYAYKAAGDYGGEDDEEVVKGMLLSDLGMDKGHGDLYWIIRSYEEVFLNQELFTDETDISDWYFECAEYYLSYEDPMGAVALLERGIKTFENPETVTGEEITGKGNTGKEGTNGSGRREDILQRMQSKRDDILAHCKVGAVEEYIGGRYDKYREFDEEGREILEIDNPSNWEKEWIYYTYDNAGNLIRVETYCRGEYGGEKEKKSEEHLSYDAEGRLVHEERYDLERGEITHERNCEYDEDGNQIYYQNIYGGEISFERERCMVSDFMQIEREYDAEYPKGEQYCYVEQKWDEAGNILETAYYSDDCTPEEIQEGEAKAQVRYYYTYDAAGNRTAESYQYEEAGGELHTNYEWEYDDRNNLIKEIAFCYKWEWEFPYQKTTIRHYDDRNLLIRKESSYADDEEVWGRSEELYTYDESDNLIQVDYLIDGEINYSVIKEYDRLGNPTKEDKIDGETDSKKRYPDRWWSYQYRYIE